MSQLTSTLQTAFLPVGMTHQFVVNIDYPSYDLGTWSRASGLQVKWKVCEHRVGDRGNMLRIAPGTTEYQNIKLSRAACLDSQTVQRWLAATSNNPMPLSGAISLVITGGIPIVQWRLNGFFPTGWSITDFDADQGKAAIETLELAHGGFLFDESMP